MEQQALYQTTVWTPASTCHTVHSEARWGWCYTNLEYGSVFMYVELWTSQQTCRGPHCADCSNNQAKPTGDSKWWAMALIWPMGHSLFLCSGLWLKEWCHRYMQCVGSAVEWTRGCGVPEGAQSSRCTSTSKGARSWKCCRGSPCLEYLLSPLPPADRQKEGG